MQWILQQASDTTPFSHKLKKDHKDITDILLACYYL